MSFVELSIPDPGLSVFAQYSPARAIRERVNVSSNRAIAVLLGIFGYGAIGEAVARIALAMGMKVIAYRRNWPEEPLPGVGKVHRDEIFERSDVLTLHCPLTEDTRELIDATSLEEMKRERLPHQHRARAAGERGGPRRGVERRDASPARGWMCFPANRRSRTIRCCRRRTASSRRTSRGRAGRRGQD